MVKYFDKIQLFENKEETLLKCDCRKKQQNLKNGMFTLKGKYFYSKKIPFLFGFFIKPIWKYVINTSYEIFRNGFVPNQFPIIVLKKGMFIGEINIEIIGPGNSENKKKKNMKKIKTFDKFDCNFIILENSEKADKLQALLKLYSDVFKMPPLKKLEILIKLLHQRMYQVYFHCPLCDPKDPIINVFFM